MMITISQYKDPYKPISIMECHKGFEHCSVLMIATSGEAIDEGLVGMAVGGVRRVQVGLPNCTGKLPTCYWLGGPSQYKMI